MTRALLSLLFLLTLAACGGGDPEPCDGHKSIEPVHCTVNGVPGVCR